MTITGHRTINTFHRYQIIAASDLKEATRRLEVSQEQERELLKSHALELGQTLGTVAPTAVQASASQSTSGLRAKWSN